MHRKGAGENNELNPRQEQYRVIDSFSFRVQYKSRLPARHHAKATEKPLRNEISLLSRSDAAYVR